MGRPKKTVTLTKPPVDVAWPREVILQNNTPYGVTEPVKRVVLAAHSEQVVIVSESEFKRINHNFKQLNFLKGIINGFEVMDLLGEENGDV